MRSPSVPSVPSAPLHQAISNYAHNQTRLVVDRAVPCRGNSFVVSWLAYLRLERILRFVCPGFHYIGAAIVCKGSSLDTSTTRYLLIGEREAVTVSLIT